MNSIRTFMDGKSGGEASEWDKFNKGVTLTQKHTNTFSMDVLLQQIVGYFDFLF